MYEMSRRTGLFGGGGTYTTYNTTAASAPTSSVIDELYDAICRNDEKLFTTLLNSNNYCINEIVQVDRLKGTLLHTAIEMESLNIISILLDNGASLNITNRKGQTCYDLLARCHNGEAIKKLLDSRERNVQTIQSELSEVKVELETKRRKISALENDFTRLSAENKRIYGEKQELEVELGKRKAEIDKLQKSNIFLMQSNRKK